MPRELGSTLVCRDHGCSELVLGRHLVSASARPSFVLILCTLTIILKDAITSLDSFNLLETTKKTHGIAEGVGNKAMAVFIKQRGQEMSDDTVTWFRSKPTLASALLEFVQRFACLSGVVN